MGAEMIKAMKQALEALENNKRMHHYCEDTWYSCPKHEDGCANEADGDECNCGADEANAEINEAITALRQAIEKENVVSSDTSQDFVDETAKQRHEQAQKQEPVAYDKTELNRFAQDLYDQKMREGKHGHYESMFSVIHQCIKRVAPPQRQWVGLTDEEIAAWNIVGNKSLRVVRAIEAKLREKNT